MRKAEGLAKVLNLFAYTGGATLAAAAGAAVTHVDASKGIVNWAKRPLIRRDSRFAGVDDCVKFAERNTPRQPLRRYHHGSPSTEGQRRNMEIEEAIHHFLSNCAHSFYRRNRIFTLLTLILLGLAPPCGYILSTELLLQNIRERRSDELGLPVTEAGWCCPGAGGNRRTLSTKHL